MGGGAPIVQQHHQHPSTSTCAPSHNSRPALQQRAPHPMLDSPSRPAYRLLCGVGNVCAHCGREFHSRLTLMRHEKLHYGEKQFQCQICGKSFARGHNYYIHMKLHASGKRFFCNSCGRWFRTNEDKEEHQNACPLLKLKAQIEEEKSNKVAGARSQSQFDHGGVIVTAGKKPLRHKCAYCYKMFHFRKDKVTHERTHTGERPYTCGYCGKGFTQSQSLTIHIRTHTGDRPYGCRLCGRRFVDSSALRKHHLTRHTPNAELEEPVGNPFATQGDSRQRPVSTGRPPDVLLNGAALAHDESFTAGQI